MLTKGQVDTSPAADKQLTDTVSELQRENERLAQQVKRLIQTEQDLYAVQEQLDAQVHIYRKLYQLGQKLNTTFDAVGVLQIATNFVIYELNLERCLVLLCPADSDVFRVHAMDGYYDESAQQREAIALPVTEPAFAPLLADAPHLICPHDSAQAELQALRAVFGMDEYVIFPLHCEPPYSTGLLVAGNTDEMAPYQTRVEPDSLPMLGLANLISLTATALNNASFYHALEQERQSLEARIGERTHELREAKEVAESANVAKSNFLANMSHELRTPLNAVLGFAQVMEHDPELSARHREHLGIIIRSGEHLLGLINSVLEMSKIEAGRITLTETSFDLWHLLQGVEEMFQLRAQAKDLNLRFVVAPELPQYVAADESKLRQVLINLLGNAVKFTHHGGITLRATYHPDDSHALLHVEVEDTGEGIAGDQLPRLFQPFVQTDSGVKSQEGTGLGLAISRQFVQLMGSDISVASTVGKGTTFAFDVRMYPAEPAEAPDRQGERHVLGIAPDGQPEYRILVVDDKWENRRLLVEWLQTVGFDVREASNGLEAVELWDRWEPHLIWMDMRMPVMDGYEATKRIKASVKGQATVVIALTASAFDHEQTLVLNVGCDDFVRKPVRASEIFDKIVQHLGVRFVYDEPSPVPTQSDDAAVPTPAALAALSPDLLTALTEAAEAFDPAMAGDVIEQIRTQKPDLAEALAQVVANFRFDTIEALVKEARETST